MIRLLQVDGFQSEPARGIEAADIEMHSGVLDAVASIMNKTALDERDTAEDI